VDHTFPLKLQAPTPRQTMLKRYTVKTGERLGEGQKASSTGRAAETSQRKKWLPPG